MHTYIYTYIHLHTQKHIHTFIVYTYIHTYIRARTHTTAKRTPSRRHHSRVAMISHTSQKIRIRPQEQNKQENDKRRYSDAPLNFANTAMAGALEMNNKKREK